ALHHSLKDLNQRLHGTIRFYSGSAGRILPHLCHKYGADGVYYTRQFTPEGVAGEGEVEQAMLKAQVPTFAHNGSYLWEPEQVLKNDGSAYRVFTPFYRNAMEHAPLPRQPLPAPQVLELVPPDAQEITDAGALGLLPANPWGDKLVRHWDMGEKGAHTRLHTFITQGLPEYSTASDYPARSGVSRLSISLALGEVSPQQLWYAVGGSANQEMPPDSEGFAFRRQLGWREFSLTQVWHNPDMRWRNLQEKFDRFPWRDDAEVLQRWQRGETGYPLVDAGMRELWETGYMHNRVRMVVGSFLVKNLLLHWHHGEAWFRDCLMDADHANNCAGWQWIAGCGADAAPYFRIFNPVTQARRFDPKGEYVRRFVPQLRHLPDKYIFEPWKASAGMLNDAGIELGHDYPQPMLDLKASRQRALDAYAQIKGD
ncbi:MAG: DNA photolyase family protein, partial [Geobacteraceae bacterium]|nr:DNA photolyase family protein [Geobacteraceae bacterium]